MHVIATTNSGARIRLKCRSTQEAIRHLGERGVCEELIYGFEVQ